MLVETVVTSVLYGLILFLIVLLFYLFKNNNALYVVLKTINIVYNYRDTLICTGYPYKKLNNDYDYDKLTYSYNRVLLTPWWWTARSVMKDKDLYDHMLFITSLEKNEAIMMMKQQLKNYKGEDE